MAPLTFYNRERGNTYVCSFLIGSGGYGEVWHGRVIKSSGIEFEVAIKVFKPTSNVNRDFSNWSKEKEIYLKCLQHPHIVTTYDQFCTKGGYLVIVMEIGLCSLQTIIDRGLSFYPADVCRFGIQIAHALDHLHSRNIIHRDISPDNILEFKDGIYKLCDFSASKVNFFSWGYGKTVIGHYNYLPPELLMQNGFSNNKSDFYQLGLVMMAMLNGRHAIPNHLNKQEIRRQILAGIPRQMAEKLIPTHGKFAWVLHEMLKRTNPKRHRNANALVSDLRIALSEIENRQTRINQYLRLNQNLLGNGNTNLFGF